MSARRSEASFSINEAVAAEISTVSEANALSEGATISLTSPENPLERRLAISIRSSINELCLNSAKGTWSPSPDALKSIFQSKKFTSIAGTAEGQGDLKSIVLHSMSVNHVSSTFPIALGAKITGVDDSTYSSTGQAFSHVVLPKMTSTATRCIQQDDTALAYEFSKKFPGYTSENLDNHGVHSVAERRFVLVSADHPLVSAISENADKLQMGEISMMPEGLVKISQSLFDSIMPLVKNQVDSQIKVRDLSAMRIEMTPAEFGSWSDARAQLIVDEKRPLKAQLQSELSSVTTDAAADEIRATFATREAALEHNLDHTQMQLNLEIGVSYNFLS